MNTILLYFAIPLLVIIVSIILEKIVNSPLLVSAFVFAVSIVVFFIIGNIDLLVAVVVYTILALITALIVRLVKCIMKRICDRNNDICDKLEDILDDNDNDNNANGCCNNRNNVRCLKHRR